MNIAKTAAPRSAVVHAVNTWDQSHLGSTTTGCGRPIGDNWAGEYSEAPEGDVTCKRCLSALVPVEAAEAAPTPITDDAGADRAARISRGRCVDCDDSRIWDDGTPCTTCREASALADSDAFFDDVAALLVGNPWTPRLVSRLTDAEIAQHADDAERAAAMRRHPAGKGREIRSQVARVIAGEYVNGVRVLARNYTRTVQP